MFKKSNSAINEGVTMKTILFVHHGIGIGGASINLQTVVKNFQDKNYNLIVLFLQDSDATKLFLDLDCKIVISKFPIYYFYHMSKWVKYWQLHKLCIQVLSFILHLTYVSRYYLKKISPDIVYLNSSVLTDWCLSCKLLDIKNVINVQETINDGYFGLRKKLIRAIITKCSNRVFFISDFNRLCLVTDEFKKYDIVYNTLECSADCIKIVPFSEKSYDFVYLGGDSYIKGWDYIVGLLKSNLSFKMSIAGTISNEKNIKLVKSDSRVTYYGSLENAASLICKAKFLLSPFKESHFSRPIMEAYYCGVVPIGSDLPGIEEQLINNISGILFPNNLNDFLKVIQQTKKINETEYNKFIVASEIFRQKFSVKQNKNTILDSVKTILERY
jgi:glycosyltransferase involved in cell wall biosynthesis